MNTPTILALSVPAAVLLAGAGAAQDVVTPRHFTNAEANTWASNGIGTTSTPSTLLMVLEEFQGNPATLNGVAFRRDGQTTSFNNSASSLLATVIVSTAARIASNVDTTFANNHGANKAQVSTFALVQWPASSFEGPAPDLWFPIPFSQPYSFDGNGPLAIEIQVSSRTHNSSYFFDWVSTTSGSSNPSIISRDFGTGCIHSTQTRAMDLSASGSANWPGSSVTLRYNGSSLPPNSLLSVVIGTNNETIAGFPLPLQVPGTAMAPSGPCTIYTDVLTTLPALSDANGRLTFNLGFAVNPFFNGLDVFAQVAALDPPANPLGLVLSDAVQHHLVAPYGTPPIGTVYSNNSTMTGTARPNQGFIVRVMK